MKKGFSLLLVLLSVLMLFTSCGSGERQPAEAVTTGPDTDVKVNTQGTWFLSAPLKEAVKLPAVPDAYQHMKVLLPEAYEETIDGLKLQIDFFYPEYALGSMIQAKIMLTNNTEGLVSYYANDMQTGYFHNGKQGLYLRPLSNDSLDYSSAEETMMSIPVGETVTLERVWVANPTFFATSEEIEFRFYLTNERTDGAVINRFGFDVSVEKTLETAA